MDTNKTPATSEIRITVARVTKGYTVIGGVKYTMVFQVSDGNWCIERHQRNFKNEQTAQKTLAKLLAKYPTATPSYLK